MNFRCPFLKDVILTIGGRVFAIWKDEYLNSPLLWRKSSHPYNTCCWSNRAGVFLLSRIDSELEVWDIAKNTQEPVFSQFISNGPITGLYSLHSSNIIGFCDYNGAFRIFSEPNEFKEECLARIEWFEEFIWREVKRKINFNLWQTDFLKTNITAAERKKSRSFDEAEMKNIGAREKFQKGEEGSLRRKDEKKTQIIQTKNSAVWKSPDYQRMETNLLKRKGLIPEELKKSRLPLVIHNEGKNSRIEKAKKEKCSKEKYFNVVASTKFLNAVMKDESVVIKSPVTKKFQEDDEKNYKGRFLQIKEQSRKMLNENIYALVAARRFM